jgi:Fe2+ or Zn2+ uptake regulation protein
MKSQIDAKLTHRNIRATAMRELVLKAFSEQVAAISMLVKGVCSNRIV